MFGAVILAYSRPAAHQRSADSIGSSARCHAFSFQGGIEACDQGFAVESDRTRALKAGAVCYLTKPFDGEALIACLDVALEGKGVATRG